MTITEPIHLDDGADGGAQLEQILPGLGALIGQVGPSEMRLATPCEGWTTHDLLNHVIGGADMFADALVGGPLRDISGRLPDAVGDDPLGAFERTVAKFGGNAQQPGSMERVLALPFGPMTGQTFLRFAAFDLLVHSWDLATTLGVETEFSDDLLGDVDRFARHVLADRTRDGVNFQEPIDPAAGATPLERLVAYTGRTS